MKSKLLALSLSSLLITGCTATGTFYKTGEGIAESRTEGCDFTIYTTSPKHDYIELGLIELVGAINLGIAKNVAAPIVCKNGGNGLLVWEADGHGHYIKATVVFVNK